MVISTAFNSRLRVVAKGPETACLAKINPAPLSCAGECRGKVKTLQHIGFNPVCLKSRPIRRGLCTVFPIDPDRSVGGES